MTKACKLSFEGSGVEALQYLQEYNESYEAHRALSWTIGRLLYEHEKELKYICIIVLFL